MVHLKEIVSIQLINSLLYYLQLISFITFTPFIFAITSLEPSFSPALDRYSHSSEQDPGYDLVRQSL